MGFAGRNTATSTAPAGAPPPPPGAATPPPAPPVPPATGRLLWAVVNGQSLQKTEAEARQLPPTTVAMFQGDANWSTVGALLPAAAVPPPAQRPAFGTPSQPLYGAPGQPAAPAASSGIPPNLFAGVENAQVMRRGSYIEPGDYVARLLSAEFKAGRKGNQVILELAVITSSYDHARPETHGCNHEGSTMTAFVKQNDSFLSNIKEIVLALSGFDEKGNPRPETDTVTAAECNALTSPEQPFAGALVYIEARPIKTRAGGDYTRVNWWPCPLNADGTPNLDAIAASRG